MGVRAGIVECPHCGNHLQDTKQEYINCRYCGKSFKRGTIAKEKEEELRRNMVLDLSDEIAKMKIVNSVGLLFGVLFLILGLILLFLEVFTLTEIILTIIFFVNGFVWLGLRAKNKSQFDQKQSKLFDLTGGRAVFEY